MENTNKKVTQRRIAGLANIGPDFLNHIIQGRKRCPPKVAERLEAATGISKLVWVWGSPCDIKAAIHGMCQK